MGTIASEHKIEGHFYFLGSCRACIFIVLGRVLGMICPHSATLLEPGFLTVKICTGELVVEYEFDIREPIKLVKETLVEPCTVDSIYRLRSFRKKAL